MSETNPVGSIKSRWHSYREGHFLHLHGVIKGSAGAGTALLLELSDDNAVLRALERNLENLPYEVIDINIGIAFRPDTELPEGPLTV
ncbi:MAG: hypothetical protein MUC88_28525 [Planctomycetes bacterium]|jgi:hypothetical protein|nr:hypothetical protein [Planctomycetota bacterium]